MVVGSWLGRTSPATNSRAVVIASYSARAWRLDPQDPSCWPELQDVELAARDSAAVCFSGGGARAYVAALGQLAALREIGLLPRLRYASAVSGGAWAVASYSWGSAGAAYSSPAESQADPTAALLGRLLPPEECDWAALGALGEQGAISAVARRSLVTEALLGLATGLAPFAAWRRAVETVLLLPRGIPRGATFTWSNATARAILARNPRLRTAPLPCNPEVPLYID